MVGVMGKAGDIEDAEFPVARNLLPVVHPRRDDLSERPPQRWITVCHVGRGEAGRALILVIDVLWVVVEGTSGGNVWHPVPGTVPGVVGT